MTTRYSRIAALLAGLETPDDLTPEEQQHGRIDLIDFLVEELHRAEADGT